jgi:hypothetical protein
MHLFFLEYAGELRIIALRREKEGKRSPIVHTDKDYTRLFREGKRPKAQLRSCAKWLSLDVILTKYHIIFGVLWHFLPFYS